MRKAKRLFGRGGRDDGSVRRRTRDGTDTPPANGLASGDVESTGSPRSVQSMLEEFRGGPDTQPRGRTPRAEKYDQLWQLSMSDPHTGLANQLLVLDRLTQAVVRRRRHGGEVVVCHIDLDNLGEINLELGYTTGTTVLCEMARRLTSVLRTEDTVGRVGSSEFVTVLTVTDEQTVGPVMRRLQHALDEPVAVGGRPVRLHATLRVALAEDDETAEDALIRADRSTRVGQR